MCAATHLQHAQIRIYQAVTSHKDKSQRGSLENPVASGNGSIEFAQMCDCSLALKSDPFSSLPRGWCYPKNAEHANHKMSFLFYFTFPFRHLARLQSTLSRRSR